MTKIEHLFLKTRILLDHHRVLKELTHMTHLITLVLFQTVRVNQVVSIVIDVASKELLCVSHLLEAQRAVGVTVLEVRGVRLHR